MESDTIFVGAAQIESVPGDFDANLRRHLDAIDAARATGIDVLLFPELSLTGHHGGRDARRLALDRDHAHIAALARASGPMLTMFGLVEAGASGEFHNSAFAVRDGALVHVHRKINLATYGRLDDGRHFVAGSRVDTCALDSRWRIAPMICADTWNPPLVHLAATQGATLMLVAVSSALEAVGGDFDNPSGWEVNLHFHALTYGMPVLMANRVGAEGDGDDKLTFWGGSRIVDPFGRTLAQAITRGEELIRARLDFADVRRARDLLPTIRDANLPLVAAEFQRIQNQGQTTFSGKTWSVPDFPKNVVCP